MATAILLDERVGEMNLSKKQRKELRLAANRQWKCINRSTWNSTDVNLRHREYYGLQLPPLKTEWKSFEASMLKNLSVTFRLNSRFGSYSTTRIGLLNRLEHELTKMQHRFVEVDGKVVNDNISSKYDWCDSWKLCADSSTFAHNASFSSLHELVSQEVELGNIVRQEVVSMIPALLLDTQQQFRLLDVCAAPGSKTEQLVSSLSTASPIPSDGVVIANDADPKRIQTLCNRLKRCGSPNLIITCARAEELQRVVGEAGSRRGFDRIICDVPCSGDGTFRKCPHLWRLFRPRTSVDLHSIQIQIAQAAVDLLVAGGRMAYSTCSINPIEDEAVVGALLRNNPDLALVDVRAENKLPGLVSRPGVSSWRSDADVFVAGEPSDGDERRESLAKLPPLVASLQEPTTAEVARMELGRCLRILPHDQDTGGFFIALLEKKLPLQVKVQKEPKKKKGKIVIRDATEGVLAGDEAGARARVGNNSQVACGAAATTVSLEKSLDAMKKLGYNPKVRTLIPAATVVATNSGSSTTAATTTTSSNSSNTSNKKRKRSEDLATATSAYSPFLRLTPEQLKDACRCLKLTAVSFSSPGNSCSDPKFRTVSPRRELDREITSKADASWDSVRDKDARLATAVAIAEESSSDRQRPVLMMRYPRSWSPNSTPSSPLPPKASQKTQKIQMGSFSVAEMWRERAAVSPAKHRPAKQGGAVQDPGTSSGGLVHGAAGWCPCPSVASDAKEREGFAELRLLSHSAADMLSSMAPEAVAEAGVVVGWLSLASAEWTLDGDGAHHLVPHCTDEGLAQLSCRDLLKLLDCCSARSMARLSGDSLQSNSALTPYGSRWVTIAQEASSSSQASFDADSLGLGHKSSNSSSRDTSVRAYHEDDVHINSSGRSASEGTDEGIDCFLSSSGFSELRRCVHSSSSSSSSDSSNSSSSSRKESIEQQSAGESVGSSTAATAVRHWGTCIVVTVAEDPPLPHSTDRFLEPINSKSVDCLASGATVGTAVEQQQDPPSAASDYSSKRRLSKAERKKLKSQTPPGISTACSAAVFHSTVGEGLLPAADQEVRQFSAHGADRASENAAVAAAEEEEEEGAYTRSVTSEIAISVRMQPSSCSLSRLCLQVLTPADRCYSLSANIRSALGHK